MKKYYYIIIPIVALIVSILVLTLVNKNNDGIIKQSDGDNTSSNEESEISKDNMQNSQNQQQVEEKIKNTNPEDVEQIKKELNATADSDIYYVDEEPGGRKILQVKPEIQFFVDLAGIIKKSKPNDYEIDSLVKKAPSDNGVWVSEDSRSKFLELLKNNNIDGVTIEKNGYINIDNMQDGIIQNKIKKMVNSGKLYIINITGIAYERDYISGEIVEYPFEDMDPTQAVETYEYEKRVILEITTNKLKELTDKEILEEIVEY